ncbi:MAG: N-methyl-L-tryptophan oxidase [Ardenticatenaceae bacterium]|nr:N-methyl-L-tryptophan oxidase [Ardenticatenaceae bacterium]HBY92513.1 N-methyl-L-tryptophan oxidase [Chloroflexota bacterium]
MKTAYEYIVIGCGGIGSAATYWLSRLAGHEVLSLEQFKLGHDRGGSQDHSRIIRLSYHALEYTALTPHTYAAWSEVEEESGVQLVFTTGGLDLGPVDGGGARALNNYAASMRAAGIPYEELSAAELMKRWPQFRLSEGERGLYQAASGLVDARKANATHVVLARAHGATILDGCPVRSIRPVGDTAEVRTDEGTFTARRLVVTSGAWTNKVLKGIGIEWPLTVTQEQVTYYETPNLRDFALDRFPIWIWHGEDRDNFYGFPVYGEIATKAGQDVGGNIVTVDSRTFEPDLRALKDLQRFLATHIPGFLGPVLYTKSCLYTMPPDRNFVLDRLPEHPQIVVAVGAGHAFKFASFIGRILSQLATEGRTTYPIDAFRIDRPALTDPGYLAAFRL